MRSGLRGRSGRGSGPDDRFGAPTRERAGAAAQPRGRGVAARRHAALARRDHRRGRGARRDAATSTSRRTATSTRRSSRCYGQGEPADPVTVAEELRRAGLLDGIGGRAALLQIQADHAGVGERGALRRDRRRARAAAPPHRRSRATSPRWATTRPTTSPRPSTAPRRWCSRSPSGASSDTMVGIRDALQETLDQLEALLRRRQRRSSACPPATTTSTSCCSACSRRTWSIVAARPGMGKTSLALGMAPQRRDRQTGRPVLFFSMEMGALELTKRLLAIGGAASTPRKLRTGQAHRARLDARSATRSAASPRRRSSSTTTRTARSWRCGPRRGASRPATATSA